MILWHHLRLITLEMIKMSIIKLHLNIKRIKSQPHLSGVSEHDSSNCAPNYQIRDYNIMTAVLLLDPEFWPMHVFHIKNIIKVLFSYSMGWCRLYWPIDRSCYEYNDRLLADHAPPLDINGPTHYMACRRIMKNGITLSRTLKKHTSSFVVFFVLVWCFLFLINIYRNYYCGILFLWYFQKYTNGLHCFVFWYV